MVEQSRDDRFVVSTHIPKTAGTTLSAVFERCLYRRIIYDYDGYSNPETPRADIVAHSEFVSSYFAVLHGHFYSKKYFTLFPDAAFVATVRDPVDRIVSQYFHELNENSPDF